MRKINPNIRPTHYFIATILAVLLTASSRAEQTMYSTENVYKRCTLTKTAHDMAMEELNSLSSEDVSNIKVAAAACLNLLIGAYSGYLYAGAKCVPKEHLGLNSGELVGILVANMSEHKDHISDNLWTGEGTALPFIFSTFENHFCNQ